LRDLRATPPSAFEPNAAPGCVVERLARDEAAPHLASCLSPSVKIASVLPRATRRAEKASWKSETLDDDRAVAPSSWVGGPRYAMACETETSFSFLSAFRHDLEAQRSPPLRRDQVLLF